MGALLSTQVPSHALVAPPDEPGKVPFHHTIEELYGAVAEYYDASWLSFRYGVSYDEHDLLHHCLASSRNARDAGKRGPNSMEEALQAFVQDLFVLNFCA